jgi:hypothetical protein
MQNYQLGEITTHAALRRQLADHFRRVKTDNPKVIDVLLFKGQAEAHEVLAHYTQRHHLVRTRPRPARPARGAAFAKRSAQSLQADRSPGSDHALCGSARGGGGGGGQRGCGAEAALAVLHQVRSRCVGLQCESATERLPCSGSWRPTIRISMPRGGAARCSAYGAPRTCKSTHRVCVTTACTSASTVRRESARGHNGCSLSANGVTLPVHRAPCRMPAGRGVVLGQSRSIFARPHRAILQPLLLHDSLPSRSNMVCPKCASGECACATGAKCEVRDRLPTTFFRFRQHRPAR